MCVIASEKRWKRDNTFFVNFGKKTKTNSHSLQCFCVQENINFVVDWVSLQLEKKTFYVFHDTCCMLEAAWEFGMLEGRLDTLANWAPIDQAIKLVGLVGVRTC